MKKTVDKIPFYRLGWNKLLLFIDEDIDSTKLASSLTSKIYR
jgi:hypothetical protein